MRGFQLSNEAGAIGNREVPLFYKTVGSKNWIVGDQDSGENCDPWDDTILDLLTV